MNCGPRTGTLPLASAAACCSCSCVCNRVQFLRHQPRNFENVTLEARRREHFRSFLADFFVAELPQKRGCFNTQEFTRFLSTGVVSASCHALWRVLSNNVIRVFDHCWVDIPHIHPSEWESLFFINCLGIELVLCDVYLTTFDLTKDLLSDTFLIDVLSR